MGDGSALDHLGEAADVGDVGVAVVADDGVAGVAQAGAHVAAHLAEADQSELHGGAPRGGLGSGEQAARHQAGSGSRRHQQVAERRVRPGRRLAIEPLMTTGLEAWVKASSTTASSMRGQAVEQELRVEAGGDVLAVDGRLDRLEACASSPEPASRVSTPSLKASWTAVLRSATSATRLTDSISAALSTGAVVWCSCGNRLRTLGNSPSSRRVVVRRTPPGAGALEADDALAGAGRRPARW